MKHSPKRLLKKSEMAYLEETEDRFLKDLGVPGAHLIPLSCHERWKHLQFFQLRNADATRWVEIGLSFDKGMEGSGSEIGEGDSTWFWKIGVSSARRQLTGNDPEDVERKWSTWLPEGVSLK